MKILLLCIIFLMIGFSEARSQDQSSEITEDIELTIPASELSANTIFILKNINGEVKVTGYDGDEIRISGTKRVWKEKGVVKTSEAEEIYLAKYNFENKICAYIQAPGVKVKEQNGEISFNWNNNGWNENQPQFEFNLELKIPRFLKSEISTINGGEVLVENLRNGVEASNVNGNIILREIAGETHANTVNGDINVVFAENPETDGSFNTVNGTIEVVAPKNFSAVVTFKSLHGELYSDFENIQYLSKRINSFGNSASKKYKIEQTSPIQIGDGGPELRLQLVNGNAFIKQKNYSEIK